MLRKTKEIFAIRREERLAALVALLCLTALNALNVVRYNGALSGIDSNTWSKFIRGWHIAGFDPITYSVITDWTIGYNIYRHPLLPYFMWPFSMLNQLLMTVTGYNCAILITASILLFCSFYSFVFINRIFCNIIETERWEANILSALTFSFAYVMLATLVPDHFIMSMFCLTLTLYLCGVKLKNGSALNMWQTIAMFTITAGVSLNNGLKIFLAALMTRRRRFFEWRYLLFAVIMPSLLIWMSAKTSYRYFVWPKEMARHAKTVKADKLREKNIRTAVLDTISKKDSANVEAAVKKAMDERKARKERRYRMSAVYKHTGKPISNGEFSRWTDISTSRTDIAVESLFGEGIMIHEDYLLGDVLVNRPVIVHYRNWGNYIVEALLVMLFLTGIWFGRHSRFMWTAISFFMLDMMLHMGLGFGINEISIMSAHYLYVLPIAMAYLLKALSDKWRKRLAIGLGIVAAYLTIWNVSFLVSYLYVL